MLLNAIFANEGNIIDSHDKSKEPQKEQQTLVQDYQPKVMYSDKLMKDKEGFQFKKFMEALKQLINIPLVEAFTRI